MYSKYGCSNLYPVTDTNMVKVYGKTHRQTDLKQNETNHLIKSHENNPLLQETMTSGTKKIDGPV